MTTATTTKVAYEANFLIGQNVAADLNGAINHIKDLLARAGADIIALRKWDERRLAYEVKGQKRGTYILTFFRAEPRRIAGLERDCNLSEQILRTLILKADHLSEEEMQNADASKEAAMEGRLRSGEGDEVPPMGEM